LIVRCRTHDRSFTLYPPGFAPYQRRPILQLAPEGRAVLHEESTDPLADFEDTLFQAALDASKGYAWPKNIEEEELPDAWWSTQNRHLELALRLLGLFGDAADRVRETIAAVLSLACLVLRDESGNMEPGYQGKGQAICRVLAALIGGERRAIRLLFCGYVIGKWGRPWTWDPSRRCLETLPFPDVGTPAPT
jgi:hypothetical protein